MRTEDTHLVWTDDKVQLLLEDSRNYMSPILVPSSVKRIATQIVVIANLNGKEDFILKVFVCDIIHRSKELPVQITCESCSILRKSMLTIFNFNDVNGIVLPNVCLVHIERVNTFEDKVGHITRYVLFLRVNKIF